MRTTDKNDRAFAHDDRSSGRGDGAGGRVPGRESVRSGRIYGHPVISEDCTLPYRLSVTTTVSG